LLIELKWTDDYVPDIDDEYNDDSFRRRDLSGARSEIIKMADSFAVKTIRGLTVVIDAEGNR